MTTFASGPVRIGVQLQPQHAHYANIRDAVARAEDLGVDVLFNWDHFFPLTGERDGLHYECWTMLAAWAEQTSRVEIGARRTASASSRLARLNEKGVRPVSRRLLASAFVPVGEGIASIKVLGRCGSGRRGVADIGRFS